MKRGLTSSRTICAILTSLCALSSSYGLVEVNVTRVGFPTLRRGDVVRSGTWVPIIVDLFLVDNQSFSGSIRVAQFDADGDECFDRVDVHLRKESGGTQRHYLYVLANPSRSQGRFVLELFNDEGEPVKVLSQGELTFRAFPAEQPAVIGDDDIVILSVSTGAIGRVQELVSPDQQILYYRPLHIGHISPSDIPELWIGLEAVEFVIWDDARPEELTERQVAALLEWVRQGGTLLIAASRTAGSLRLTKAIDAVLPVDLGAIVPVHNLPGVRKALLATSDVLDRFQTGSPNRRGGRRDNQRETDVPWWDVPFDRPCPLVKCEIRAGSTRIPNDRKNDSSVITRRRVGRGHVIFSAVTLRDLLGSGGSALEFFQELFHLRVLDKSDQARPERVTLFPHVVSAVAFATSGSVYLLVAAVFSIGYVLAATFGSWTLLGIRGLRRHSWSAFAITGITASLLSVVAVNSLRGFGETLHQISIVDAEAGDSYGHATAFFGVKTGTDRRLDLWLPSDWLGATGPVATTCFLRPIPAGNDPTKAATSFADPEEYRLVPASAVVDDVRIRATLKRFEGRWVGPIGGSVTAEIVVRGSKILEGSYIVNNLGVDLEDCYILHTILDLTRKAYSRSDSIQAFPIGALASDGRKVDLASLCYPTEGEEDEPQASARADPRRLKPAARQSTLAHAQSRWGAEFRNMMSSIGYRFGSERGLALGQEKNALLLLSTVGEHDPGQDAGMAQALLGARTWSRDRLRQLDLRTQLRRDSVILIGFASDPGPVRLFRRTGERPYRILEPDPDKSWTMYRIRIPVKLLDPPRDDSKDDETEDAVR